MAKGYTDDLGKPAQGYKAVRIRIRPSKIRISRPASSASVVLALTFSSASVLTALSAFTMLCWKVGSEQGELPAFPVARGFWQQRGSLLLVAILGWLFARLISSFALAPKVWRRPADELNAESLRRLVVAPE
jgi:hypothetical protein